MTVREVRWMLFQVKEQDREITPEEIVAMMASVKSDHDDEKPVK